MFLFVDEHNITDPENDVSNNDAHRQARSEFQSLYEELDPQSPVLLNLLMSLIPNSLQAQWNESKKQGCSQEFIDSIPRVPQKKIPDDDCPICYTNFHEDKYPLVVKLPHCNHIFDLQCLAVWLSHNETCPVCRDQVTKSKEIIDTSTVELQEDWGMYG